MILSIPASAEMTLVFLSDGYTKEIMMPALASQAGKEYTVAGVRLVNFPTLPQVQLPIHEFKRLLAPGRQ